MTFADLLERTFTQLELRAPVIGTLATLLASSLIRSLLSGERRQ